MARAASLACFSLLLAMGCAPLRYPSVVAVDALTGTPLHAAYIERETTMWQPGMPGLPVRIRLNSEKLVADGDGTIAIPEVTPSHRLIVACDGYEPHTMEHPWRQQLNPIARTFGAGDAYVESGRLVVPLKPRQSARDE